MGPLRRRPAPRFCAHGAAARARTHTVSSKHAPAGAPPRARAPDAPRFLFQFHEILDELADRLGLDRWRANRFEISDGKLTGQVSGPIIGREAKRETLLEWAEELGVDPSRTVAIGDGANDLGMMSAAGLSVAFDAKPVVREQAHVSLPDRDMRQVLHVLGLAG